MIYAGMQRPLTMFGLPWLLFGLCGVLFGATAGGFVAAGFLALSLPAALFVLAVVWTALFRRQRRDHHFTNELMTTPGFWRKSTTRTLVAGQLTTTGKGGKR